MNSQFRHLAITAAALGLGTSLVSCNSMVYPGTEMQLPDAACGYPGQSVAIPAEDGTILRGWFFNRGANTPLVAMYGGNAMNVGNLSHIAATDTTRSYILINYRGYGNSAGEPSEQAIVSDARYCIRYARAQMGNPSAPLYLVGFSLGTGVATQLATTEKPAGLVLICPFDSMTSVACNVVPFFPRILPLDSWNSARFAPGVTCPVTIMRARYDQVVPAASTDKLIQAFPTPPRVRQFEADHNTIFATAGLVQEMFLAMPVTEQCQFDF
ncbi:MAG: alpha/beta fold hydrolase [Akkermansia sp.]|nr:alpha/beta fold hydrolase [Akkermansia sp.]MBR2313880.1 alpha/beta fold hydrolase [Akkermansia sp.]